MVSGIHNVIELALEISNPSNTTLSSLETRLASHSAHIVVVPLGASVSDNAGTLYDTSHPASYYKRLGRHEECQGIYDVKASMLKGSTGGSMARHIYDGDDGCLFRTTQDWSKKQKESCGWMTEDSTLLALTSMEDVFDIRTKCGEGATRCHCLLLGRQTLVQGSCSIRKG